LLLATTLLVTLWTYEWMTSARAGPAPPKLAWAMAAAMWTRYEAWLVVAATLVIVAFVRPACVRSGAWFRLAMWPTAAALLFVLNSRMTVGSWFVTGGFYEPDPFYDGQFWRSVIAGWWGTHQLGSRVMTTAALIALAAIAVHAWRRTGRTAALVPIALFAAGALPAYAFYEGHPFRIRYMIPTLAAAALFCGGGVGSIQSASRARLAALIVVAATVAASPPWSGNAPMIQEAQWDVPRIRERRLVTDCLAPAYRGDKVLASMGSLAHYMQEL